MRLSVWKCGKRRATLTTRTRRIILIGISSPSSYRSMTTCLYDAMFVRALARERAQERERVRERRDESRRERAGGGKKRGNNRELKPVSSFTTTQLPHIHLLVTT